MLRTYLTSALLATIAAAQTWTECSPLNSTCPSDPALGTTFTQQFNKSMTQFDPNLYNITAGTSLISFGQNGAALALHKKGDSVEIRTQFYIFWGQFEIIFQSSPGAGIISTAIMLSNDLDEVDWEIIGSSSNNVSCNWFGHGNQTQRNAENPLLDNPSGGFHNYTVDWNQDRLQYLLDGNVVRTVNAAESGQYPQTPSYIRFGIWSAGDSDSEGTRDWAGGATDWSQAPFIMNVKSLRITDGTTNATQYTYGDKSGSWNSIQVQQGQSKAYQYMHQLSSSQSAINSWNGLSNTAKIGIAAGVLGAFAIAMVAFCIYCMMQRKKGREEKRVADKEWEAHESELMEYRRKMAKGGFAVSSEQYNTPQAYSSPQQYNSPKQYSSPKQYGNQNRF